MAARLCDAADTNSILVTDAVRAFCGLKDKIVERGTRDMKGFAKPVEVFEVLWA